MSQPTFTDQMGRTVQISSPPRRIVSLVPSQTELLYSLGLEKEVVGITKFCVHPEHWFRTKSRIGGTKNPRIEKIQSLQPDLIIGNLEENRKEDIEVLEQDYPVWMSDIKTFTDALEMITQVGQITHRQEKSKALVDQLDRSFTGFRADIADLPRKRAAYFIWQNPYMVAGGGTFIHEMLRLAGFDNIFAAFERYPVITLDDLQANQPEVLLLSSEPFPFKEKHKADFQTICPKAKVEIVDGELFSWYGSRLVHSIDYFKALHTQLW